MGCATIPIPSTALHTFILRSHFSCVAHKLSSDGPGHEVQLPDEIVDQILYLACSLPPLRTDEFREPSDFDVNRLKARSSAPHLDVRTTLKLLLLSPQHYPYIASILYKGRACPIPSVSRSSPAHSPTDPLLVVSSRISGSATPTREKVSRPMRSTLDLAVVRMHTVSTPTLPPSTMSANA